MAKDSRKEYEVEIGGLKHTFLLDEDDAKRFPNATQKTGAAKAIAEDAAQATASAGREKALMPDNKASEPDTK